MGSSRFRRDQPASEATRQPTPPDDATSRPRLRLVGARVDGGREPSDAAMTGDEQLILALGEGCPAALGALYDRHAASVFAILVRMVGEQDVAEELLQEVFLTVWQQVDVFDRSRGTVGCWLRGIAHNLALVELRRRRRRPQAMTGVFAGERDDDERFGCVDPDLAPLELAWRAERNAGLARAVDHLPPPQQVVLALYAAGFSQSEIAAQLGEPLGTIKSRMRLGLARLREALPTLGIDADSLRD
jgi:RNA polymerase sigma-70 factor, ECF subfamily